MLPTMLPKLRNAWRRRVSAASASALAVAALAGLAGVNAAPARAQTTMQLAYVLDSGPNVVRVVDVATSAIVDSLGLDLPTGYTPVGIAGIPGAPYASVLSAGGAGQNGIVTALDIYHRTLQQVPVCAGPVTEMLNPNATQLWVACSSGAITVIQLNTLTVAKTLSLPSPAVSLAFAPDGTAVYALNDASTTASPGVTRIDTTTGAVSRVASDGYFGRGMVISQNGATLIVGDQSINAVSEVNIGSGGVATTLLDGTPDNGVLSPDGTMVYYCVGGSKIEGLYLSGWAVGVTMALPCGDGTSIASSLAFSADGSLLYADRGHNGLAVISPRYQAVTATIKPGALLVDPTALTFLLAQVRPQVASISPAQGYEAGGGQVVITGGPFVGGTGATSVSFGGVPATSFTVDSDTQITAVVPPHVAGTVEVSVANDNGAGPGGVSDRYTYQTAPPTVSSLSPSSGVSSGGTTVVITGTSLATTTAVYFGGTAASSFTVDSDTQVTAVTRAQTNGTVNVSVTNAAGTSTSVPGSQFTFFSPVPVVTSVSPPAGFYLGTTDVTVTGMRFTGTFRVTVGGVTAAYQLDSDSQLSVVVPPMSSSMTPASGLRPDASVMIVDIQVITDVGSSQTTPADRFDYVVPV